MWLKLSSDFGFSISDFDLVKLSQLMSGKELRTADSLYRDCVQKKIVGC